MKKCISTIVLFAMANLAGFAQLKINQYGRVGIGIDPHPDNKVLIKGNLCLTTFPEIPYPLTNYTELRFKVGNGWPGCEIGTPSRSIAIWSSEVGFNDLYAAHYYVSSDRSVKANLKPLTNSLENILKLNVYSYNLKYNSTVDTKKSFGFVAQEVHELFPDMTDSAKGIMLIDYQQVIPLLVAGIKEQQQTIENLTNELNAVKSQVSVCCASGQNQLPFSNRDQATGSVLFQNQPNPFSQKTVVAYTITEKFNSAMIMLFDMQGGLKKSIPILKEGEGQVTIEAYELKAGMYIYSLVIDGKEIDSKRMIVME